jgi:serine/threonine protein kinase
MADLFLDERGGETVVLKRYKRTDALHYEAEKKTLRMLNGTVGIIGVVEMSEMQITMKYYPRGDLLSLVSQLTSVNQTMPLTQTKRYARELLHAIQACHSLGIAHMDIKLDNILVAEDGRLILTDFGMAVTTRFHRKQQGTMMYMAPEVYSPRFEGHRYDTHNADMWSYAATIFILMFGHPPFTFPSVECPFYNAYATNRSAFWDYYKLAAPEMEFIESNMVMTYCIDEKRPSAAEALQHIWFEN